jgi:uncharacterized protein (TIGR02246 family)
MEPIERLLAERECERLVMRYSLAVNSWDIDAFVDLFTPDAVWQRPKVAALRGHDEIRAFMQSQPLERTLRHVDGLCMVTIDDDGRTAASISQTTVYDTPGIHDLPAPLRQPHMVVEYRDRLVRTPEGWRFASRHTTQVFSAKAV